MYSAILGLFAQNVHRFATYYISSTTSEKLNAILSSSYNEAPVVNDSDFGDKAEEVYQFFKIRPHR